MALPLSIFPFKTLSIVGSCVLALIDHPEVVKKAQLELDRVIKPGHLPDFNDQPSLPYITAIVKEGLRWNDAVPMGMFADRILFSSKFRSDY